MCMGNDQLALPCFLEHENDPRVLKYGLSYAHTHIKILEKEILRLKKLLDESKTKDEKQSQYFLNLNEKLSKFRDMLFGKKSEKRNLSDRYRKKLKKRILLESESLAPAPKKEELKKLKEIRVNHELSSEELSDIAEKYGYSRDSEWELLKIQDETEEISVKPTEYVRKKHVQYKYRLKASKQAEKEIIVSAPCPKKIVPGSKYSAKLAVEVVSEKYLYHLPLERIRRKMEAKGLKVFCKTLYSLCYFVSCYLESVAKDIKKELKEAGRTLHIDETPWPINNSQQKDGFMWVMSHGGGSFYHFSDTRSAVIAKEFLGSYEGPVLTDGYSSYKSHLEKKKGIKLAHCWAHARRKFIEVQKSAPLDKDCEKVLGLMEELFKIEREATTYEKLKELRQKKSKKVLKKLLTVYEEILPEARVESHLRKAIDYSLKRWKGLTLFLEDERIPLTNNEAERALRQSVMGRKNFHGSRTQRGAKTAEILYTVIESCKKVELDPKDYMLMAVKNSIEKKPVKTPLQYAKDMRS